MFNRILWYFKQLFPLTYRSRYWKGDKKVLCIWKMWFGKCYYIEEAILHDIRNPKFCIE